jgi:hypothetical protein
MAEKDRTDSLASHPLVEKALASRPAVAELISSENALRALNSRVVGKADSEWKLLYRLNPDSIVNRGLNSLFASEVALGRLNGYVPKQKLDLFEFSSRRMT